MKYLICLLFVVVCWSPIATAKAKTIKLIKGEGRFYSHEEDSLSFVNKQLLFSAFSDVISKEFGAMGLDSKLFWEKFDEKFDEHFAGIKQVLDQKYEVDEETGIPARKGKIKEYKDRLRQKKLISRSKFGRLARAIKSYSIKKRDHSIQYPNSKYIRISAKIDRKVLNSIYNQFISAGTDQHFSNLYLSVDFGINGMSWNDVGVSVESDFTDVVQEHWKRWLEDNLKGYVDNIVIADIDLTRRLAGETTDEEKSLGLFSSIPSNSLWLKINVRMSKTDEDELLKLRFFKFDGDYLLIDMNSSKILSHYDFTKKQGKYSTGDLHTLSSNIASLVFNMPLEKLGAFTKNISKEKVTSSNIDLQISNLESVSELFEISKLLQVKGITMQLVPTIKSFTGSQGIISVAYQGTTEQLEQMLLEFERESIGRNKLLGFDPQSSPYTLKLSKSLQKNKQ